MPPSMNFRPSPSKMSNITHQVHVGKAGGALQGSWDVPSAHSIDRTSAQFSVTDQLEAATAIQRVARGKDARGSFPVGGNHIDIAQYMKAHGNKAPAPGKASGSFAERDAYAESPYGEGYAFVNNPHDQFGSTTYFNESKTSGMADPKPTAQMRVKSGYTGHVPHGRDHIGSTYRMHDNRGSAGKTMVPIPSKDISAPNDEYLAKMKRNLTYHQGLSGVMKHAGQDNVSSMKVPERVSQLLSDKSYEVQGDATNFEKGKFATSSNVMAGYTGHVPQARDVIGTTFYGPTVGNFHHGPSMPDDPRGFVKPSGPNKFSDCP